MKRQVGTRWARAMGLATLAMITAFVALPAPAQAMLSQAAGTKDNKGFLPKLHTFLDRLQNEVMWIAIPVVGLMFAIAGLFYMTGRPNAGGMFFGSICGFSIVVLAPELAA